MCIRDSDWIAFDRMAGGERQASMGLHSAVYAASDFRIDSLPRKGPISVRWGNDRGILLDTARGAYTIDMVGLPDTTIVMKWTDAQMDTLRRAAVLYHIMDLD